MKLHFFCVLIVFLLFNSCQFFVKSEKELLQELDTIVDFTSVDTSPTFTICKSLIDKEKQTNCFRNTIQQKVGEKLATFSLEVKNPIDEIVVVTILINQKGNFKYQELQASEMITNEIPELDSILRVSVESLPKIYAAVKRGIPVATQYDLPIRIKLEEN